MKAMAKDPDARFGSAAEFAEALLGQMLAKEAVPSGSVGVLPFRNLSPDPENEYFTDGITEDVIAHLSKIRALKVISHTSVMQFKNRDQPLREIGSRLDVTTILEGSVRRAGDRVRIVAQLIDVATDQHLWAETYDRQLTDIFAIQTDVALQISAALKAELAPGSRRGSWKAPTSDLGAYQLSCRDGTACSGIPRGRSSRPSTTSSRPPYGTQPTRWLTPASPGHTASWDGWARER